MPAKESHGHGMAQELRTRTYLTCSSALKAQVEHVGSIPEFMWFCLKSSASSRSSAGPNAPHHSAPVGCEKRGPFELWLPWLLLFAPGAFCCRPLSSSGPPRQFALPDEARGAFHHADCPPCLPLTLTLPPPPPPLRAINPLPVMPPAFPANPP